MSGKRFCTHCCSKVHKQRVKCHLNYIRSVKMARYYLIIRVESRKLTNLWHHHNKHWSCKHEYLKELMRWWNRNGKTIISFIIKSLNHHVSCSNLRQICMRETKIKRNAFNLGNGKSKWVPNFNILQPCQMRSAGMSNLPETPLLPMLPQQYRIRRLCIVLCHQHH